jgi:cell division protein FtsI (penicillin-binding protein 3)
VTHVPPIDLHAGAVEAAPARRRIRWIAYGAMALFAVLTARAGQLALAGAAPRAPGAPAAAVAVRASIVDRHGEVLAVSTPSATLIIAAERAADPAHVAARLAGVLPGLDAKALARRIAERGRGEVRMRGALTPRQQAAIFALGLPGVSFEPGVRRFYPQGESAGHLVGGVNQAMAGDAGVERGLEAEIARAGAAGRALKLSIDLRVQHVLFAELAAAATASHAKGGAGVVLDGRTGETLALASWPPLDPNDLGSASDAVRLNRAGAVYEMGSTIKPFVVAAALDAGVIAPGARVETGPLTIGSVVRTDPHPLPGAPTIEEALAHSSNTAMARLALKLGPERMRAMLAATGLDRASPLPLPEIEAPLLPRDDSRLSTAVLGYGHGLAVSAAALAGAYTIFCNDGAYVAPTLLAKAPGDPVARRPAFSPAASAAVLAMLEATVESGTGRLAAQRGLALAGKTGTAEKPGAGGYDSDRQLASFAAVFPAKSPRFVIVMTLDEPAPDIDKGRLATGGATAAPAAGRAAARIAAVLGPDAIGMSGVEMATGAETPASGDGGS